MRVESTRGRLAQHAPGRFYQRNRPAPGQVHNFITDNSMSKPKQERISFGTIKEVIDPPNLIEIQTKSYEEFLQRFTAPDQRLKMGLQAVLSEHFPIESYDKTACRPILSLWSGAVKR